MAKAGHKSLTIEDVKALGLALVDICNRYPNSYRTERDFYPLVIAYLHGRVPAVTPEQRVEDGAIDFRVGGSNPAVLELAVATRALIDPHHPGQRFPGHSQSPQLGASQNKSELKKLRAVPQSRAKNRYLLLLDLRGTNDFDTLRAGYQKHSRPRNSSAVRVVFVRNEGTGKHAVGHFNI